MLSQEDTPVSAPALRPGPWRNNYSFSVTFQYASLMNFDQLSIRTLWSAYSGFQAGRTGFFRSASAPAPACGRPSACCRPCRPARSSPSSTHHLAPRYDVVDRQLLAARLGAAILASVMVPLENVAAAEGHMGHRQPVVVGQRDHFRHPQLEPHRLDVVLAVAGPQLATSPPRCKAGSRGSTTRADSFHNSTSARATVATFTGCQLRFKISVGRWSTLVIVTSFPFKGIWPESNRHLLVHSQPCRNRYTTDTIYNCHVQHPDQDSNPEHLVRTEA